jgi:hypothetical protein
MRTPARWPAIALACAAIGVSACNAILDTSPGHARVDVGDAGADGAAAACGDLATDGKNCGVCGHGCLGGECRAGVCQPVTIGRAMVGDRVDGPLRMLVDTDSIYWRSRGTGGLFRCSKDHCVTPTQLVSAHVDEIDMMIDTKTLFWTELARDGQEATIRSCPVYGCPGGVPNVVTKVVNPTSLDITLTSVLWTSGAPVSAVSGCSLSMDCSNAAPVVPNQTAPTYLIVQDDAMYWLNEIEIPGGAEVDKLYFALLGDFPQPVFVESAPNGIGRFDVRDKRIYATTVDDHGTVFAIDRTRFNRVVLAVDQRLPVEVRVDDDYVYWLNAGTANESRLDGSIMRCAREGCGGEPTVLAAGQPEPRGLVLDNAAVYWGTRDGSLMKVAK